MAKDPKKKKIIPSKKKSGFPGSVKEDVVPPEKLAPGEEGEEDPITEKDDFQDPALKRADGETGSGIKKKTEEDESAEEEDALRELNAEIDANFKLTLEAEKEWIDEAKEDIRFKTGEQWSEDDKLKLKNQSRPCLTFNKIKAIVKLLTGHFIQNTGRIRVQPEGGEDQQFSDVSDRILNFVDEHSTLEFNFGYLFSGGQTTGRGHIELLLDYERDPIFGQLESVYHGRPGMILMDPRGNDYDLNKDRQFGFKLVKKTKAELKDLYPDKEKEIEEISSDTEMPNIDSSIEGDRNNYGNDPKRTTVGIHKGTPESLQEPGISQWHVKEYWRFKRVEKWYVYFVDSGDMPEFDDEAAADAESEKRKAAYEAAGGLPEQWAVIKRKRRRKEMHVAIRCGGQVLADGKSPFEPYYSGFGFFQYLADWTPEAEKLKDAVQGIVRCLKDPQREKNKARSQFLHIINTAANSGWIVDEDALDQGRLDELKSFGSTPGIVIKKKKGSSVTRIEPVPAPLAQQVREKAANDDFTEVSGINTDLLALDESANPSGKAIALRIRQGLTILEPDFRNFRYTKKIIGTAIMQMVPTLFDAKRLEKILGAAFMKANKIDGIWLKTYITQIEDLRYNVSIAEQGDTKTMREETFEDLMQIMEKGTQLPFEVLVDYMSFPNKAEVLAKVQEYQAKQQANAIAIASAKGGGAPGAVPGAPAA